jgi:hypothetical protein
VVSRGQIWTLIRGSSQYRVLVISNDEYNGLPEVPIWALTVARDVPHPNQLAVRLSHSDPLAGAFVRIPSVVQVSDRSALRTNCGFVSPGTMTTIETTLREFLELP